MPKHTRKSLPKPVAPAVTSLQPPPTQKRGNVELFMECVDEDLAPSQKEAERKAETEYQSAVQCVQSVKSVVSPDASVTGAQRTKSSVSPRRGRPPKNTMGRSVINTSTAATNNHVAHGSSGRGRGRGTKTTVAPGVPGKLTRCRPTWLTVNSRRINKTSAPVYWLKYFVHFCMLIYLS